MHLRLVIDNASDDTPWTLDASSAELVAGSERIRPMLVAADAHTLPAVIVERGQKRAIDFYFSPPAGATAFRCKVVTPRGPISIDADTATLAHAAPGHGPSWWADPHYPWPILRREDGVMTSYLPPAEMRAIMIR